MTQKQPLSKKGLRGEFFLSMTRYNGYLAFLKSHRFTPSKKSNKKDKEESNEDKRYDHLQLAINVLMDI